MVKWLLSVFFFATARVLPPRRTPLFLFFWGTRKASRRQVARRKRKKTRGGARSFVCGPARVLGQLLWPRCRVVCGMLRCLTRHTMRTTITTEEAPGLCAHVEDTTCRTTTHVLRKPPREILEAPRLVFFAVSHIHLCRYLDVVVTTNIWNLIRFVQCTGSLNECHKYGPASSFNGSLYKAFSHLLGQATSCW